MDHLADVVINSGILARRHRVMAGKAREKAREKKTAIRPLGQGETSAVLCSAGD
jgi:hypothetical protein